MKLEFGLCTLPLKGKLIYRRFGQRLSKPSVGRIMRILGFNPQKPLYRAWQREEFPALKAKAKRHKSIPWLAHR